MYRYRLFDKLFSYQSSRLSLSQCHYQGLHVICSVCSPFCIIPQLLSYEHECLHRLTLCRFSQIPGLISALPHLFHTDTSVPPQLKSRFFSPRLRLVCFIPVQLLLVMSVSIIPQTTFSLCGRFSGNEISAAGWLRRLVAELAPQRTHGSISPKKFVSLLHTSTVY